MPRRASKGTGFLVFLLAAAIIAATGFYFVNQARTLRRVYAAEAAITPAPTLSPPALYAKPTDPLLRSGSIGPEVQQLQQRLQELRFYDGALDGHYGDGTRAAVVLFQQQHGLVPDGMAGEETLQRVYAQDAGTLTLTPAPALPASRDTLPVLINRTNAVAADTIPADLVRISDIAPKNLLLLKDPQVRAARQAVQALARMVQAAQAEGLMVWQVSEGYRTFQRQQELFDGQVLTYMSDDGLSEQNARTATLKTVAQPGTSEHHSGLAFDLTVPDYYFVDTPQALWLEENCWDYGFILRYTAHKEDITGYLPEPWHVRYVGEPHAKFMQQHDLALEEYIALYH